MRNSSQIFELLPQEIRPLNLKNNRQDQKKENWIL